MSEANEAAKEIGVTIIGGHTGYSSGITRPVVAVTALAPANGKPVIRTRGAEVGDHVVITGGAGIEGTSILAVDFADEARRLGLTESHLSEESALGNEVSIVDEALILAEWGATSMHDVTRGGILETTMEIATLSDVPLEIESDRIPKRPIVERFAELFRFDPLKMISSGSLVATLPEEKTEGTLQALRDKGIAVSDVGMVTRGKGITLNRGGSPENMNNIHSEEDELARMWALYREE